uniref:Uncharacterized protein n=1 Tax=Cacopsylla melanoneura TaxID=428564 RepID=A0A8D8YII7_9HEMI
MMTSKKQLLNSYNPIRKLHFSDNHHQQQMVYEEPYRLRNFKKCMELRFWKEEEDRMLLYLNKSIRNYQHIHRLHSGINLAQQGTTGRQQKQCGVQHRQHNIQLHDQQNHLSDKFHHIIHHPYFHTHQIHHEHHHIRVHNQYQHIDTNFHHMIHE